VIGMKFCWHGCGAFSLRLAGVEVLVDPYLSPPGSYGPWYTANPHAPALDDYFRLCAPDFVLITHGHFDHLDLEAARALCARSRARFAGSAEAMAALAGVGVPAERLCTLASGHPAALGGAVVMPVEGVHWQTGAEGTAIAAKFAGRPDRYGAMPCGGPAFGYLLRATPGAAADAYISGDTMPEGVPLCAARVAVLAVTGPLRHPRTGEVCMAALGTADLVPALQRLSARVAVVVHWDFPLFVAPVDIAAAARAAEAELDVTVVVPPYNRWVVLP
jgi:L-ascorbate metabolism protein UlaG (beta-lactamase superfamily)